MPQQSSRKSQHPRGKSAEDSCPGNRGSRPTSPSSTHESSQVGGFPLFSKLPPEIRIMIWCQYFLEDYTPSRPKRPRYIVRIHQNTLTEPGRVAIIRANLGSTYHEAVPNINKEAHYAAVGLKLKHTGWLEKFPDLLFKPGPVEPSRQGLTANLRFASINWSEDLVYIRVIPEGVLTAVDLLGRVPWRKNIQNLALTIPETYIPQQGPGRFMKEIPLFGHLRRVFSVVELDGVPQTQMRRDRYGFVHLRDYLRESSLNSIVYSRITDKPYKDDEPSQSWDAWIDHRSGIRRVEILREPAGGLWKVVDFACHDGDIS
ncbi:hypothetical protein GGS26DRAFT_600973 [Hypomontagnella submonticulosa]|nr:hypothetical protein GGS26DRAFT_600973 [Hypomontagnella submonticulosa]